MGDCFDDEIIFEDLDLDFDNLPKVEKPFVRCNRKQREFLTRLAEVKGLRYHNLIKKCNKVIGREIRDIGEMSIGEIDLVIKELN